MFDHRKVKKNMLKIPRSKNLSTLTNTWKPNFAQKIGKNAYLKAEMTLNYHFSKVSLNFSLDL